MTSSSEQDLVSLDPVLLIKYRLQQMGYNLNDYDFDLKSLSLVQRLLADVVLATEAARKFKLGRDEEAIDSSHYKDQVYLLITRLIR